MRMTANHTSESAAVGDESGTVRREARQAWLGIRCLRCNLNCDLTFIIVDKTLGFHKRKIPTWMIQKTGQLFAE